MSEALTDALLRRAQSGWKDVWDAGKYAFGPEGYRDLKKNIRYYGGPHLGSTVNDVLDVLPELLGPGADVRDMVEGSDALTKALMKRDGIGALEGGTQLFGGLLGLGIPGSVGMFAGPGAKNADMGALQRAEDLAAQGADARKIWDETGWFQGADGKWRFEIDDSGAGYRPTLSQLPKSGQLTKEFGHPALWEAYNFNDIYADTGSFRPGTGSMQMPDYWEFDGSHFKAGDVREEGRLTARGKDAEQVRDITLHELQHGVQFKEGTAVGSSVSDEAARIAAERDASMWQDIWSRIGPEDQAAIRRHDELKQVWDGQSSIPQEVQDEVRAILARPGVIAANEEMEVLRQFRKRGQGGALEGGAVSRDDAFDRYKRSAGEVEARNVQTRRDFTPDQRRAQPPWETEDVPRDRQIVRFR